MSFLVVPAAESSGGVFQTGAFLEMDSAASFDAPQSQTCNKTSNKCKTKSAKFLSGSQPLIFSSPVTDSTWVTLGVFLRCLWQEQSPRCCRSKAKPVPDVGHACTTACSAPTRWIQRTPRCSESGSIEESLKAWPGLPQGNGEYLLIAVNRSSVIKSCCKSGNATFM